MVGRMLGVSSAGLEARLYGSRQDACCYLGCGSAALSRIAGCQPALRNNGSSEAFVFPALFF